VKAPRRLSIPGCIGCGAMRQYESCAGACRERRLELVSGGDYDELTAAAAACRVRIEGLWDVVGELARREPGPGEWRAAYEAVRLSARSALRRFRPAAEGRGDELPSPAETVIVWRCQDCGGVDAPHPVLSASAALHCAEQVPASRNCVAENASEGMNRPVSYRFPLYLRAWAPASWKTSPRAA